MIKSLSLVHADNNCGTVIPGKILTMNNGDHFLLFI